MSDKKPPPSITESILANPKVFLPEQRQDGQPTPQQLGDAIGDAIADAKDAAAAIKAELQGEALHVGDERSGQLTPSHSPTISDAGGGQPGGWVRARHPADSPPPSITKAILDNPHRFLPPGPETEHDRDKEQER